ncbi:contractile injection system protein, VgrG/Pvc8 family [Psychrobacter sp. FBL11]|uniref:Contractile injection system protein, VgrG/Pvc8 family n=1 Tax=Psychrobacter saeujeotis TaxID=3143436 RepID=A0ABU9X7H3_9GAMM|nr:contractile injection system protein, VgrG/Pvc8 family [uncultured Psychrobacter sp.]
MPSQTARLHQLKVGSDILATTSLYPSAFFWTSSLNQSSLSHILVFSYDFLDSNACLSLISKPICLTTLSAAREPTCRCGLIQTVRYQHSDGAMHFYTLDIVTPDWQLTQSIHTRSFTHQSTLDIITAILNDYDFEWQLSEQLLSSDTLTRPLEMRSQSDVSDYDFISGLLADIGVTTYWVSGDSVDELGYWSLVSALDENALSSLNYSYEKSSVQSGQDSVDTLQMSAKQLGTRTVLVRADGLAADTIYEGVAEDDSPLTFDDTAVLFGAPSRVYSDASATRLAEQWVRANGCNREYYSATGAMRGLSIGSQVSINNLPSIGRLSTYCTAMIIVGIEPSSDSVSYHNQVLIRDWLTRTTKQTAQTAQTALSAIPEHGYDIARDTGIWVTATLLDSVIPYCPYPSKQSFVSSRYSGVTQARTGDTSTSSSPSYASQVTDDGLQRTITTPVSAGISPHDDGVTPPLRALQLSSGATHGWQFAPRLGQSVLLNHWYGDIDSPMISRSLYDGIGMGDNDYKDVTRRDAGLSNRHNLQNGSSPRWHGSGLGHSQICEDDTHSGWITGIAQYGLTSDSEVTLLFDDTPKSIGLEWTVNTKDRANAMQPISTSSATFASNEHVLELGVLRHRYSNHQSTSSGQGINLATDHGLQATAESGVLLSTFGIQHSQSEHESAWVNDAGQRQLKLGKELTETFLDAKQAHLQSTKAMKTANQSIEAFQETAQIIDDTLQTEVLGAPDVMLVSKDSILASASNTLSTAKTIVRQSGSTHSDVVAGNYTLTADSIESLAGVGGQAQLSGLHISANTKPLAIQAQGGELQLHCQQSMTIGSESGQVNISSPRQIKLQTSAGASLTIDESGVKLVCPGEIKVQAVKKSLVGGAKVNAPVIALPTSGLFSKAFDLKKLLPQDLIDQGISYKLINHSRGTEIEGKLDEDGQTLRVFGDKTEKVELELLGNVNRKGEIKVTDVSDQIECDNCSIENLFEDCGDNHAHDEDDFDC